MSQTVTHHEAQLDGLQLHYARAGDRDGPAVLLIHGWPQTWYEWRHVAPLLDDFDVVMPDLRGLGDSSIPADGYDKRTLARDLEALITDELHSDRVIVVGHDWGGVVAVHLAWLLRDRAAALAVIDVTIPEPPGDGPAMDQGGRRWHHAFHRAPDGLAEAMIAGHEGEYYGWFYRNFGVRPDIHSDADVAEYLASYRDPRRTRAGLELYRAFAQDQADAKAIRDDPLAMPVLALGGGSSFGRGDEPRRSLERFATDVEGWTIADCGHWIPEEQPAAVADAVRSLQRRA